jgi:hypothetical protein
LSVTQSRHKHASPRTVIANGIRGGIRDIRDGSMASETWYQRRLVPHSPYWTRRHLTPTGDQTGLRMTDHTPYKTAHHGPRTLPLRVGALECSNTKGQGWAGRSPLNILHSRAPSVSSLCPYFGLCHPLILRLSFSQLPFVYALCLSLSLFSLPPSTLASVADS